MKRESDHSSKSQSTTNDIPHRAYSTLELISIGKRSSLVLNQICNQIIDRLIMEWYPGLLFEVKAQCLCPPCEKAFLSGQKPVFWNLNTLLQMKDKKLPCVTCFGPPPSSPIHITGEIVFIIRIDDLLGEEELVIAKEFLLESIDIKHGKVPIGTGAFGIVYKGEWNLPNKSNAIYSKVFEGSIVLAIKKPHPNAKEKPDIQSWKEEAYMLSKVQHETIVKFCGVYFHPKKPFLVFEFIEGKSLDKLIFERRGRNIEPIEKENKFLIAFDIAKGMQYLHRGFEGRGKEPIIHRDLKPENIMIVTTKKPYRAKICDFGLAVAFKPFSLSMKEIAGTPQYMAPEVYKRSNYDEKVDVWSYGMVVWALFSEKKPFPTLRNDNDNLKEHFEKLTEDENYRPEIPEEWQKEEKMQKISEMMKRCWNSVKPTERPSFEEICESLVEMNR